MENTDFHGIGLGEHGFPRDGAWRTRISTGWGLENTDFHRIGLGEHGFPRDGGWRICINASSLRSLGNGQFVIIG